MDDMSYDRDEEIQQTWERWAPTPVRHSTMWPGRCVCGCKTMMVSGDIARSHGKAYECGECYQARMALKKLDGLVNG